MGREGTERTYFNMRHPHTLHGLCDISTIFSISESCCATNSLRARRFALRITPHKTFHNTSKCDWLQGSTFASARALTPVLARPQACTPSGRPARRFLYYLSYIKVAVAMAMYLPQVLLNHERRSTAGFSIEQVLGG